jgi:dihydropteroate synthase-like protein
LNPSEINAGIEAGAELVLSLCSENMGEVKAKPGVAYVVIPDSKPLSENLKSAEKLGFKNLIADPILSPPFKVTESLLHYKGLRTADKKRPMMAGVGNVVELIDADSTGVNGLLAAMAVELDVSLLLTTENSSKTRGSVRELRRALDMCFLARSIGTQPKDLGFDLLMAKGKGPGERVDVSGVKTILAGVSPVFTMDPKGPFTIFLDFKKGKILAAHSGSGGYDAVIEGETAEAVSKKIITEGLVSSLEHAAYLGRELEKAEIFLKLRKGYVQDDEFEGI